VRGMKVDELRYNCDGCPCLNTDFEQGATCNLGYETDLRWTSDKSLHYMSIDCGLISVIHNNGEYKKGEMIGCTHIHPIYWPKIIDSSPDA
jgi:hypothetical protein